MFGNVPMTQAASVERCGQEPVGGTLTDEGDYCQISFEGSGSNFSWSVPEGVTELQGLLVGAGAGANSAFYEPSSGVSYGGHGGSVSYIDLSTTPVGTELSITVGQGGTSLTDLIAWTAGGPSEIKAGATVLASALGGESTGYNYCSPAGGEGYGAITEEGRGAGGQSGTGTCFAAGSPGIFPSTDANSTSLFKDLTPEAMNQVGFGVGGILSWISTPTSMYIGQGAGATLTPDSSTFYSKGSDGAVFLRFNKLPAEEVVPEEVTPPTDVEKELADTGVNSSETLSIAGAAAVMVFAGTSALLLSRRRRNS
jgi:LPXTG-motif cell wall-anchored protein